MPSRYLHALALGLGLIAPGAWSTTAVPWPWHPLRVFEVTDGLPRNEVLAITFDQTGRVYAGTSLGLASFDGVAWERVSFGQSGAVHVGALATGADASLWIGTADQGLFRRGPGSTHVEPLRSAIDPGVPVSAIRTFGTDGAFVATRAGLWRCDGDRCSDVPSTRGLAIRSLWLDLEPEPMLWLGTESGLRRLERPLEPRPDLARFRRGRADGIPNDIVVALTRWPDDPQAPLWIGSGRGLARLRDDRIMPWPEQLTLPSAMVTSFASTRAADGEPVLLAGLRPGGLLEIRSADRVRRIGPKDGLPDDTILSLAVDAERGSVWIEHRSGGLARTEPGRWIVLDERHGLPDRNVVGLGFFVDAAGHERLWTGTARGAVEWRDGRFVPLLAESASVRRVHAVAETRDGRRWLATERGLLVLGRDSRVEHEYTVDNSALPAVSVNGLARRRDRAGNDEIWIATNHGLARWRADTGLARLDPLPGSEASGAVAALVVVATDQGEAVWVAQAERLARVDDEGRSEVLDCVGDEPIQALASNGSDLWIASDERLLRVRDLRRCEPWPTPPDAIGWSHLASTARLLVAANPSGIWRIPIDDPQRATLDTTDDGLPTLEPAFGKTLAVDRNGRLYVGTKDGLAILDPRPAPTRRQPPRLDLDVTVGPRPVAPSERLTHANADPTFRYRLIDLWQEHRIAYRTRLVGLDPGPGPWSARHEIGYPRLPAGRYRFEVEARDASGLHHGPATFEFEVLAPLWQRPPALAAYALALITVGLLLGRWRARAAERRATQLEATVAARTAELAQLNRQLERAASVDPLTGLFNRREFERVAPTESERAIRLCQDGQRDLAVLVALIDVDRFKSINDRHGHAAGDAALVVIAERLRATTRSSDLAFRWGSEEFLVLERDLHREQAAGALRRLLEGLAGPFTHDGLSIPLTVSIGAVLHPLVPAAPRALTLERLIALADEALYRAKQGGRDRAVLGLPGDGSAATPVASDQVIVRSDPSA